MKFMNLVLASAMVSLGAVSVSSAASVEGPFGVILPNGSGGILSTPADPIPGGIGYRYYLRDLVPGSTVNGVTRHVGVKSWRDSTAPASLPLPAGGAVELEPLNRGWTHNSDWIALELDQPGTVEITLSRAENVPNATANAPAAVAGATLLPAFTLWSGWDNDAAPSFPAGSPQPTPVGDYHGFNNGTVVDPVYGLNTFWAEDLTYFAHVANPDGATVGSVTGSFSLPAGTYTLAVGGNPLDQTLSGRMGYSLSVSVVPEPATLALAAASALTLLRRR